MRNAVNFEGKSYPDRRIKSLQAASTASLDMRTMEVDTVELTLDVAPVVLGLMTSDMQPIYTADGYRLCVMGDSGGLSAWSQADPITLTRGGSQYAIWYPRQVKPLPGDYVSISGTSPLGRLTQMEHRGGIYAGTEAGSLIREICGDVPVYVSSVFEHVALYGYLPYVSPSGLTSAIRGSAKDNLLKVLFALNASLRVSAEGVLRVENLDTAFSSVIDRSRVYRENAALQEDTPITSVTVLEHQYVTGTDATTLFEGTTTAGQVVIFREPCSGLTATGFTILSSGANWAELSAGTGTLTGVPYIHITREVTRTVSQSDVENAVRIEDATLVGITNSSDVADRMAAYYASRTRILVDATVEFERPGDVVSVFDPVAKLLRQACIEKMSPLNLSQTMKAKLSLLVGFTPWQTVPFDDVHELITTDSTYTFPADIAPGTNVNAILIGGGQGGFAGTNGEAGQTVRGGATTSVVPAGTTLSCSAGSGGSGGAGGAGGSGGNVYLFSFLANPSDIITASVGAGGASGGNLGNDSTLTVGESVYSSASGSPGGYRDNIDQISYGSNGADGVSGASGGKGRNATEAGTDANKGGDVGIYIGGSYGGIRSGQYYRHGGGGGGGASQGNNGGNGLSPQSISSGNGTGGAGGAGAAGASALHYGDGGNGGNGGGGGGGGGACYVVRQSAEVGGVVSYGGTGGTGGAGSAGAQGCVILIYRKPAT